MRRFRSTATIAVLRRWMGAALVLAALARPGDVRAGEPPKPAPTLQGAVANLVARLQADTAAQVGVHVVRLSDGATLCSVNAARPMLPASNQKILTSAVALKRLGADFSFHTQLAASGDDLVVYGDGDPTTGDSRLASAANETIYEVLDRWVDTLKAKGVAAVPGNLVIQTGIFQPPMAHPDWPIGQRQRWYSAPVAGVNFNDNCLDISFVYSGKSVQARVEPASRFLAIDNRVKPGKRSAWSCRFADGLAKVTLLGTVSKNATGCLAVPDPPTLFGKVLADRLALGGIELGGKVLVSADPARMRPDKKPEVLVTETTPLSAALGRCNKYSLNMMAECLFLRSAVADDAPATWERAAEVARKVLTGQYGLPADQFVVADGSGYSRRNRASPACITALLRALAGEPAFVKSLAVAGVDGSLEDRLTTLGARGRILGKTGSLAGASALSGYVTDEGGQCVLAFSILVNGRTYGKKTSARATQDAICRTLIQAVDAAAPARK